jgi:Cysteine-rich secretory protein family
MAVRRWTPRVVGLVIVVLTVLLPPWSGAHAASGRTTALEHPSLVAAPAPDLEAQFVSRINSLRASKGLPTLQVSGSLVGVARAWTEQMTAADQISHNPDLAAQVGGSWTKLGENVGVGYDVGQLMDAFIASPAHYDNLVDPTWTHLGVGVTMGAGGRMFTTHNFMALGGGAPAAAAPPTTAPPVAPPTTAPPVVTTTTTAPPPPPPPEPHPTEDRVAAVLDPLRSLEQG